MDKTTLDRLFPTVVLLVEFKNKSNGEKSSKRIELPDLEGALYMANEFMNGEKDTYDSESMWFTSFTIKSDKTVMRFVPAEVCDKTSQRGTLTIQIVSPTIHRGTELIKIPISCFNDIVSVVDDEPEDEDLSYDRSYERLRELLSTYEKTLEWVRNSQRDGKHYDYEYAQLNNELCDLYEKFDEMEKLANIEDKLEHFRDILAYKYMLMRGWQFDETERWVKKEEDSEA